MEISCDTKPLSMNAAVSVNLECNAAMLQASSKVGILQNLMYYAIKKSYSKLFRYINFKITKDNN